METRSTRNRRDSDCDSTASEPIVRRSRSTTPFTLRSHCTRHGSECPEGRGIHFRNRLSPKRGSGKKATAKMNLENQEPSSRNGIKKNLLGNPKKGRTSEKDDKGVEFKASQQTSDYSSGEEGETLKGNSSSLVTPASHIRTPLQRSAEKTDYTYAKSYSYRTEVTPDRVIVMPNMTRRSIERSNGEKSSSPELRTTSRNLFASKSALKAKSGSGWRASYGTDYDSDHEAEEDVSSYELKPPPATTRFSTNYVSSYVWYKMKIISITMSWWIYLINCYSLLLDTDILQSKGISKLRCVCRQQKKNAIIYLLLFFILPLILLLTGGLSSILQNAFYSEPFEKLAADNINFPGINIPSVEHLSTTSKGESLQADINLIMAAAYNRELIKEDLTAFHEKLSVYDGKIGTLDSSIDSLKAQLDSFKLETKPCCDQYPSPAAIGQFIDAKIEALAKQLSESAKTESTEDVAINRILSNVGIELQKLNEWKQIYEASRASMADEVSQLRGHLEDREKIIIDIVAREIDKANKRWETDTKALIGNMKDQLLAEISRQIEVLDANSGRGLSKEEVKRLIHSALGVYDSDKTGLADYALEPAGGVVLSTRCTEPFSSHRPRLSIWGFSLWSEPNNPRVVIQPGIVPGQCWSFRGFDGYLVIQLSRTIIPTAFTLEHIPKSLAPDGQIDSAPRNFTVFGLINETDTAGVQLGQYIYDRDGEPLQTFQVQEQNHGAFPIVELRIHSNYGNVNYTCLYRFRVHGRVAH